MCERKIKWYSKCFKMQVISASAAGGTIENAAYYIEGRPPAYSEPALDLYRITK